ncbi:unnamed protein product [Cyprideis torosa]|uniref:Uncharacterized protein n=1 Tax=Cyprideis torosa TaxID=163714 RepID=A0A7R8ZL60_9CRUS|nr:unnamed protein product [Cyprideis torosa]CAG0882913.1 unnamed protein product [Cyprideis torosa]
MRDEQHPTGTSITRSGSRISLPNLFGRRMGSMRAKQGTGTASSTSSTTDAAAAGLKFSNISFSKKEKLPDEKTRDQALAPQPCRAEFNAIRLYKSGIEGVHRNDMAFFSCSQTDPKELVQPSASSSSTSASATSTKTSKVSVPDAPSKGKTPREVLDEVLSRPGPYPMIVAPPQGGYWIDGCDHDTPFDARGHPVIPSPVEKPKFDTVEREQVARCYRKYFYGRSQQISEPEVRNMAASSPRTNLTVRLLAGAAKCLAYPLPLGQSTTRSNFMVQNRVQYKGVVPGWLRPNQRVQTNVLMGWCSWPPLEDTSVCLSPRVLSIFALVTIEQLTSQYKTFLSRGCPLAVLEVSAIGLCRPEISSGFSATEDALMNPQASKRGEVRLCLTERGYFQGYPPTRRIRCAMVGDGCVDVGQELQKKPPSMLMKLNETKTTWKYTYETKET